MEEKARKYTDEIRSVVGVVACALVSCEGLIMGKCFRGDGASSSLFAAMSATVLASAEAVCGSVHVKRPSMVTITAADATILIVSVGEDALITAVIDMSADLPTVQERLLGIAAGIGEEA
ncbi:roadblock/LC7 domain-containing protein [Methanoculleus sp.]|uniref:roadblock/LC7 domain-containing protein n=1 Tax=Methanoculleus sp. TaxID=90427 RepID=UPI0025CD99DF|nr:roadblock/LC7 domain-containing protein [Methanoculleus sp.]